MQVAIWKEHFPRLGELHIVMAALTALGTSIENSGIDDAWIEADVYGSATTRQNLKCAHHKRTRRARIHMYMALLEILPHSTLQLYLLNAIK